MNPWETYEARNAVRGVTRRDTTLNRAQNRLARKMPQTLSFTDVSVDGVKHSISVIDTDNLDTKLIFTMPNETVKHGGIVEWEGYHWIITEKDAHSEVYTKAKMRQCNYLLKWVDGQSIIERWCIVEDGTRYLSGEMGDREFVVLRGDSRVAVTLPKDEHSLRLGRENRFIIDDYGAPSPLAYRLTKPFKLGGSFDEDGVLHFVMYECNTEDDDNLELHIADYYTHFPRENTPSDEVSNSGGWI